MRPRRPSPTPCPQRPPPPFRAVVAWRAAERPRVGARAAAPQPHRRRAPHRPAEPRRRRAGPARRRRRRQAERHRGSSISFAKRTQAPAEAAANLRIPASSCLGVLTYAVDPASLVSSVFAASEAAANLRSAASSVSPYHLYGFDPASLQSSVFAASGPRRRLAKRGGAPARALPGA